MRDGSDGRFARWSRRKLAARGDPANTRTDADGAADATLPAQDAAALPAAEPETSEPEEPLPRLEDLTADSDLTAFLKKGVPMALKSAAMRKMWSIDPSIRDYVGPAEYAWDFNQPGSMAGFGPLDAEETIVGFLSKTVRALGADTEATEAALPPEEAPPGQQVDTPQVAETTTEIPTAVPLRVRPPVVGAETTAKALPEAMAVTASILPADNGSSPNSEPLIRPRHGGAMPR